MVEQAAKNAAAQRQDHSAIKMCLSVLDFIFRDLAITYLHRYDLANHPPHTVWNAFSEKTDYFAPSTRDFMLNFAVDDLDAFLARLQAKGVAILKRDDQDPNGRFAWILDPDGTKLELWEPKPRSSQTHGSPAEP